MTATGRLICPCCAVGRAWECWLCYWNRRPRRPRKPLPVFDQTATRWLEILANQVALAVEHARLIQENAQVASLKRPTG